MIYNKETQSYMCDRCGKDTNTHIMSWFNKDEICPECKNKERSHPRFQEAKDAVIAKEKEGNMNWEGIGLPEDLVVKKF